MNRDGVFHLYEIFRSSRFDPVPAIKDVFLQEVMTLAGSEFENEALDMDSIKFASEYLRKTYSRVW